MPIPQPASTALSQEGQVVACDGTRHLDGLPSIPSARDEIPRGLAAEGSEETTQVVGSEVVELLRLAAPREVFGDT